MISRSFELGRFVCTRINVAKALCISTLALRVNTPDSIASDVVLEKRVGREILSGQSWPNVRRKIFRNNHKTNTLTLV